MRTLFRSAAAITAAGAMAGMLAMTGVSAAGAAAQAPPAAGHAVPGPGSQLWARRYNGPGNGSDQASKVAVSPDGTKVFVTGTSQGKASGLDYATVAYSAVTGARLWAARYNGPANGTDSASRVTVSPDGTKVFVTGISAVTASTSEYATVAYNAATGARLWVADFSYGPFSGFNTTVSLAVSPDGTKVYLSGTFTTPDEIDEGFATVAYNEATGAQLWVARYSFNQYGGTKAMAVSPDGTKVYVERPEPSGQRPH